RRAKAVRSAPAPDPGRSTSHTGVAPLTPAVRVPPHRPLPKTGGPPVPGDAAPVGRRVPTPRRLLRTTDEGTCRKFFLRSPTACAPYVPPISGDSSHMRTKEALRWSTVVCDCDTGAMPVIGEGAWLCPTNGRT